MNDRLPRGDDSGKWKIFIQSQSIDGSAPMDGVAAEYPEAGETFGGLGVEERKIRIAKRGLKSFVTLALTYHLEQISCKGRTLLTS
ncbi:MAG: hypothetical protein DI548_07435 [Flavobacterium johnsoniae]|nr:MAG: hypothetical protein DI548_07435 [Flavobacterium johnsoniae]